MTNPPDDSSPQAAARRFIELLAAQRFADATAMFDAKMTEALSTDELGSMWAELSKALGGFKEMGAPRREDAGPYRVVNLPCVFANGALDAKLAWDDTGKLAGLFFSPPQGEYAPPPYATPGLVRREVVIGEEPWKLPGELVLPTGSGPFPAVVLVHGSGPGDRNESVGPNRPFEDLALGLASKGIAVLRYDKRTRVHGKSLGGVLETFTVKDETITDAVAAAALLRADPEIDPARVFVLGHSLGGQLAPRIAEADPKLAGLVVLAGSTGTVGDAIVRQTEYILKLGRGPSGELTPEEQTKLDALRKQNVRLKEIAGGAEAKPTEMTFGAPPSYWRDLAEYDAPALAAKVGRRILVLQGERDYQVTMIDFAAWKKALDGKPSARLVTYPKLNHLMISGEGPSGPEEYKLAGHVDEAVIADVAEFVLKK